jgi:hypothetical protein
VAAVKVLEHPLDAISRQARPYPADMLPEGGTGLCLFAAAFLGHNDAIHFARAEMKATCVDVDEPRLREMCALYPDDWSFRLMDAWQYAETYPVREAYDVVSVDTFTGDATDRSLQSLELWCSLATKAVTVTIAHGQDYTTPTGWRPSLFQRSAIADWLVLRRD